MMLLKLFAIFFYVGLFTIGGGLASIPLVQEQVVGRGWLTLEELYNMVAVAESTPGPIGENVATYVGFRLAGIPGALIASLGLVLPELIIIVIIAVFFKKFADKPVVKSAFYGIRAGVIGLISVAAYNVLSVTVLRISDFTANYAVADLFDFKALSIFCIVWILYEKFKKHPIFYIILGGILGVLFY